MNRFAKIVWEGGESPLAPNARAGVYIVIFFSLSFSAKFPIFHRGGEGVGHCCSEAPSLGDFVVVVGVYGFGRTLGNGFFFSPDGASGGDGSDHAQVGDAHGALPGEDLLGVSLGLGLLGGGRVRGWASGGRWGRLMFLGI